MKFKMELVIIFGIIQLIKKHEAFKDAFDRENWGVMDTPTMTFNRLYGTGYPTTNTRALYPEQDRMMKENREHLLEIVLNMMKDARYKFRQTDGPRLIHRKSYAYEIGFSLGIIRETYKHMVATHRMVLNKYNKNAGYPTLFYGDYRLIEYFNNYELIHQDEVKIDKLCELIMAIDIDDLEKISRNNMKEINDDPNSEEETTTIGLKKRKTTTTEWRPRMLRNDEPNPNPDPDIHNLNSEEFEKLKEEVKLKRAMRQEYLMRKLGRPANASTTMKRFQNGWPVEETWDHYSYTY